MHSIRCFISCSDDWIILNALVVLGSGGMAPVKVLFLKLPVVALGKPDPVRAFESRSTSPTSIPSYCLGLFSFLFVFCSETVCAPLGFPYYPLLVLSSAAEDVSNFFPPCHGISPSSVLHDNEHTTDSDRAESIPLARTTRRIIRISNC